VYYLKTTDHQNTWHSFFFCVVCAVEIGIVRYVTGCDLVVNITDLYVCFASMEKKNKALNKHHMLCFMSSSSMMAESPFMTAIPCILICILS
jgi:hypothetical protein